MEKALATRYGFVENRHNTEVFALPNINNDYIVINFEPLKKTPQIDFDNYNSEKYIADINAHGVETLWNAILDFTLTNGQSDFLSVENFGSLYEMGLAEQNKTSKKECGQYFTPDDVSCLMARWLKNLKGENVCDVACGTGNLILAYLKEIGSNEAKRLLSERKIYLYDCDQTALKIAQYSIALLYGEKYLYNVNLIHGDFLDRQVFIPTNSKVISNPPYAKISQIKPNWIRTENLLTSGDLYSAFIEKIATSGSQAVIISPYSFIGGSKFYPLRKVLNNFNGFVVAFDNVPANIFNGKKHGIFNSNTANSVRAAIAVIENKPNIKGFRTSHLIRFKADERAKLLSNGYLEHLTSNQYQIASSQAPSYIKCHKELTNIFAIWNEKSNTRLRDLLSNTPNEYALFVPNTCRYFTTASSQKLNRSGMIELYAKDQASFDFLYCLINSSFAYWHWRLYDGGITYQVGLLHDMPIFDNLLTDNDRQFFQSTREQMTALEKRYRVTKLNAGVEQENIKFPKQYRDEINARFLTILGANESPRLFDLVHGNSVFGAEE